MNVASEPTTPKQIVDYLRSHGFRLLAVPEIEGFITYPPSPEAMSAWDVVAEAAEHLKANIFWVLQAEQSINPAHGGSKRLG